VTHSILLNTQASYPCYVCASGLVAPDSLGITTPQQRDTLPYSPEQEDCSSDTTVSDTRMMGEGTCDTLDTPLDPKPHIPVMYVPQV
jgi:hypothetical protein